MTTGNSGTDGIIDRHEESRNALKILGCHQTIHLNFADTRAHLQLNDMISALEDIIKKSNSFWCWNHAGIYHAWCRPPSGSSRCLSSFNGCLPHYSTNSRLRNPKLLAFIYASGFESVKEEYFTVKLAALKHKSRERRDYMRHDRLRAVAQFRGQQVNSDLGEGFVIHKMILWANCMKTSIFIRMSIAMLLWF